ncbi:hypothetical protein Tco_1522408 [Tanacetum coccineum]
MNSKVVNFTKCQNLRMQVKKLKSENDGLKISVEELPKAREIVEVTLRKRDEMVSARSMFETKNLELVKEIGDIVKRFDEEKKVFETKISKLEKALNADNSIAEYVDLGDKTSMSGVQEEGKSSTPLVEKINIVEQKLLAG